MATISKYGFKKVVIIFLAIACGSLTLLYPQWQSFARAMGYSVGDLSISAVEITQAVSDPDIDNDGNIDLVLERETALLITVGASLTVPTAAIIEARLGGQVVASTSKVFGVSGSSVVELFFTPQTAGDTSLVVEIDPNNAVNETNETNNTATPVSVSVRSTKHLVIPNVPVGRCRDVPVLGLLCFDYSMPIELSSHVAESNAFMQAAYPVADSGFSGPTTPMIFGKGVVIITTGKPFDRLRNIIKDMTRVYQAGKEIYGDAKRAVGVVPKGYFDYHKYCDHYSPPACQGGPCGVRGLKIGDQKGVLVTEGHWTASAHEIGHTFDIAHNYMLDAPSCTVTSDGNLVSGYWVKGRSMVSAIGFMGTSPPHEGLSQTRTCADCPTRWVSKDTWETLFRALESSQPDPELLLLSAIIENDGRVELLPMLTAEGIPDSPPPGPYTLELSDASGTVLLAVPFDANFTMVAEPFGEMPSDIIGIDFAVPYPKETSKISMIAPNGTLLVVFDPVGRVLQDAIETVPDQCFAKNPSNQRNALRNKVAAINKMLEAGNTWGAIKKLENDVSKHVNRWLVDNCSGVGVLEYSKEDLVEIVNDVIVRISTRQ